MSGLSRLPLRLRGRRRRPDDNERGSLPLVMLMSIVSASLGALLVPTLVSQNNTTRTDVRSVSTLSAAETGIEVAVGQIRAASVPGSTTGTLVGVRTSLPCGPLGGTADSAGLSSYSVSITYYPTDPVGQSASWLAANSLACTPGSGTAVVPGYALLVSAGSETFAGTATTRTIQSTYIVQTTNANIPGGPISIDGYCFDAGTSPADGTPITLQNCSAGLAQQKFIYTKNLTLQLSNSASSSDPFGLCFDAGPTHSTSTPTAVLLQPCQPNSAYAQSGVTYSDPNNQPLYRQQWGFSGNNYFMGSLPPNGPTQGDGTCLAAQLYGTAGSPLIDGSCGTSAIVVVAATVGAGRAGATTSQYVDFSQFGRCLDVDGENVANPLISYPCKQVPSGLTTSDWNQTWVYNSTTLTMTTYQYGTTPYCLTSPLDTSHYVMVSRCTAAGLSADSNGNPTSQTVPQNFQWTQHLTTSYATKYEITDFNGNCLTPNLSLSGAPTNSNWVTTSPCDGSTLQKWNADPNILNPTPLENTAEK